LICHLPNHLWKWLGVDGLSLSAGQAAFSVKSIEIAAIPRSLDSLPLKQQQAALDQDFRLALHAKFHA